MRGKKATQYGDKIKWMSRSGMSDNNNMMGYDVI